MKKKKNTIAEAVEEGTRRESDLSNEGVSDAESLVSSVEEDMFLEGGDAALDNVDAAKEDGSLGRLVNDDHINPNAIIKFLRVQGKLHLCLFAIRTINPGDKITYNSEQPWRCKESGIKYSNYCDDTPSKECLSTAQVDALKQKECPKHHVVYWNMSAFDKCSHCLVPFASLRWMGFKCKDCPGLWHISCYRRMTGQDETSDLDESNSPGSEYVLDSDSGDSDSDSSSALSSLPSQSKKRRLQLLSDNTSTVLDTSIPDEAGTSKNCPAPADDVDDAAIDPDSTAGHMDVSADETSDSAGPKQNSSNRKVKKKCSLTPTRPSFTNRNFCFICGKPQSKLARHLKTHMSHPEVSRAFYLPVRSKERKVLFEKMRNKGNFKHNSAILQGKMGQLKVKRKPKAAAGTGNFVHCMHCMGLYIRKDLWRHVRRCPCRPQNKDLKEPTGRTRVLTMATAQETVFSQHFSSGMWNILSSMKMDETGLAVRNDLSIVHFAQSLYNRHEQDPTKHEYVRQKLREVGRLLVCLRSDFSIHSMEEAIKPSNFETVVKAVQKLAGFDEEKLSYRTPSLALKLGHTLKKICEIVHCRALMAEDDGLVKLAEKSGKLYTSKWCELVSHSALNTLSSVKYNKAATLPFTEDVRTLHRYLQKSADTAVSSLMEEATTKTYAEQGKSLDEIEIEDEMSVSDPEARDSGSDSEDSGREDKGLQLESMEDLGQSSGCPVKELSQNSGDSEMLPEVTSTAGQTIPQSKGKNADQEHEARRLPKRKWSNAEVAAVMRHFGNHISKGKPASNPECKQCKEEEYPVLSQRTVQHIRDFVRNRITTTKKEARRKL